MFSCFEADGKTLKQAAVFYPASRWRSIYSISWGLFYQVETLVEWTAVVYMRVYQHHYQVVHHSVCIFLLFSLYLFLQCNYSVIATAH